MALKTDWKAGDIFTHTDLNLVTSTVNTNTVSVVTAATDNTTTKTGLTGVQTIANKSQGDVTALLQTQTTTQATLAAAQAAMTLIQNRLTVLETATPPPAVPGPPTGLTHGTITNTTIPVSWTAPAGTAPTTYTVRRADTGTMIYGHDITVSAPTVTATFTGLTPAAGYDIVVIANNAAGPGGQSAPLTNVRTTGSFTPSPAWTEMPPATPITMNDGGVVTLAGGIVYLNAATMGNTAQVILVVISDTGRIYQESSALGWWYWDPTQTDPWVFTSDPRLVAPPSGGPTPPAAAAAVGFNTRTFGDKVLFGSNWFAASDATITTNTDGSVHIQPNTYHFDDDIQTMTLDGASTPKFHGIAFGGGGYFEAVLSWTGPGPSGVPAPAFWANDIENQLQAAFSTGESQWPGQAAGYVNSTEIDFLEANAGLGSMGFIMIDWYGFQSSIIPLFSVSDGSPALTGTDNTQYHKYAGLIVPATATTQGYYKAYFDDVQKGNTVFWNQYDPAAAPPPVPGTTAWARTDVQHLYLMLGSGSANPMTIKSVSVWQKDATKNLTN
jgi:hypothetical protein